MFHQVLAQVTDNGYTVNTVNDTGAAAGSIMLILIPVFLIVIIYIVGMWKVFTKAGKPGWASIIPIYNFYVMLQIAGRPAWWILIILLGFIPVIGAIANLVLAVVIGIDIAKRFGKGELFGGLVCGLLGVGYLILGYGSAQYKAGLSNDISGGTPNQIPPTAPTQMPPSSIPPSPTVQ